MRFAINVYEFMYTICIFIRTKKVEVTLINTENIYTKNNQSKPQ